VPLLPTACAASAARPPAGCWPSCCACRVCVSRCVWIGRVGLGQFGLLSGAFTLVWLGVLGTRLPAPQGFRPGGNDADGP
jgi:hypothetical protein